MAEIEKVEKIADIARMGVAMTPALAVDGQAKLSWTTACRWAR